jgi:hypothetical protein
MPDLPIPEMPAPGLYRHYKGGLYTLISVGRHSETGEWLVIYRSEASKEAGACDIWVRPLAMWSERVGGVPRFAPYSPASRSPN